MFGVRPPPAVLVEPSFLLCRGFWGVVRSFSFFVAVVFLATPDGPGDTPGVKDLLGSRPVAEGEEGFVPDVLGTLGLASSFFFDSDSASESVSSCTNVSR